MEYVSQQLAEQGWIVERIRMGQDDYLQINKLGSYKTYKTKVKALSQRNPVPFHTRDPSSMNADLFVICRNLISDSPEVFTATKKEVSDATHKHGTDYWLETEDYEKFEKGFGKLGSLKTF